MDTQAFLKKMNDILEIEDRELSLDDKFREFDEWDSLAYLSIVTMISVDYGITISAAEFRAFNTFGDIVKAIEAN